MHPAGRKSCSSLKLLNESFWQLQIEFCVILWTVSHQVVHSRFWKLITFNAQKIGFSVRKVLNVLNAQKIGFSVRKVLNVRYFFVLNVRLGGLLFIKFNATENIRYCLNHFICSLISINTYSSASNLFVMSKQTEKAKKLINWVILVADIYV